MALNKLKFNSINVTPAANEALKFNSSANGFETGSAGGAMTFIKKLTASSSSTLSFVDGSSDVVLDNTYKEYIFLLKDIHPSANGVHFEFNGSIDSGSNYNVTKTTSFYNAFHYENGSATGVRYNTGYDHAQSTSYQRFNAEDFMGDDADQSLVSILHLFDPSSTTFVKHFIATSQFSSDQSISINTFFAGYFNTTSAIDAVQFRMSSGNIDAGTITLYGIN
jgi:hypothetical protein